MDHRLLRERGLILVDTKYEFGFWNDSIILMDELHTCDSSRYWKADNYRLVSAGSEPEKIYKDCIRDYVKQNYSNDEIKTLPSFTIPDEVVEKVNNVYKTYHNMLTDRVFAHSLYLTMLRILLQITLETGIMNLLLFWLEVYPERTC